MAIARIVSSIAIEITGKRRAASVIRPAATLIAKKRAASQPPSTIR